MGYIITRLVALIYLHIRYRDDQKVNNILKKHYNDSYSAAGMVYLINVFGAVLGLLILVSIPAMIYGAIVGNI